MNRIKRISIEVLKDNKDKFGVDFDKNKEVLNKLSIIRSKMLKNELAGYITRLLKNERADEMLKSKYVETEEQLPEDIKSTKDESKDEVIVEESSTTP